MTAASTPATEVTDAFLLGWAVSETLGHMRRGTRASRRSAVRDTTAPRLVASDGEVRKETDAFLLAVARIVQFYRSFSFEAEGALSPLTEQVFALPARLHEWLDNPKAEFYSPLALRDLLNAWSLQTWARLNADSGAAARAFTAGMSLADTYWDLTPPARRPKDETGEQEWQRLLSKYRLAAERYRLKSFEQLLPPLVIPVIANHLREWSIGTELEYREGKPIRNRGRKKAERLEPKDEGELHSALERQERIWERLLFGLREAPTYLERSDRVAIDVVRAGGLFLLMLAVALLLVVAAVVVGLYLSAAPLAYVQAMFAAQQPGISDLLAIVSLLWTALIAVPVPFILRTLFHFTRNVQQRLDDGLKVYFITRRTLVPWDWYLRRRAGPGRPA